jgi:hypothetical protein
MLKQLFTFASLLALSLTAQAGCIGLLPYNIYNGALMDATPVMGNFNYIQAQVNANCASLLSGNTFIGNQIFTGNLAVSGVTSTAVSTAYTPTIVGASSVGATTYTTQTGVFSQVANTITAAFNMAWSAITGTGTVKVTLPTITTTQAAQHLPVSALYGVYASAVGANYLYVPAGANYGLLYRETGGVSAPVVTNNSTGTLNGTFTYLAY